MRTPARSSSVIHYLTSVAYITLAMLGLLLDAYADPGAALLDQGAELNRQGKYQEAMALFSSRAEQGDPIGAYGMGVIYFEGEGVPKDMAESSRWFRIAAEKDYAPAQYNLGNAYLNGRGVEKDLDQAEHWWRMAAQQGYIRAQFNLGALLHDWGSLPAMREEGIAWLRISAESGFAKSLESLTMLEEPVDYSQVQWVPEREPLRSEARLLTFDPKGFTLQLLSGREADSAQRFIKGTDLPEAALAFRFVRGDELWTGVVHGFYQDRGEARAMSDRLKPELKGSEPWIRPLSEVQGRIREVWRKDELARLSSNAK